MENTTYTEVSDISNEYEDAKERYFLLDRFLEGYIQNKTKFKRVLEMSTLVNPDQADFMADTLIGVYFMNKISIQDLRKVSNVFNERFAGDYGITDFCDEVERKPRSEETKESRLYHLIK